MNDQTERTIELKGLREDNPRDFLAALGLLRLLELLWEESAPSLAWKRNGTPNIHLVNGLPNKWHLEMIGALKELFGRDPSPVCHGNVIKSESNAFRNAVQKSLEYQDSDAPLALLPSLLYASYSSQLTEEKGDKVEPTWFSFSNGQGGKNLLKDIQEMVKLLEPEEFLKSLVGEGVPVSAKSFRWNPIEFRSAAYRSHDPGSGVKGDDTLDFPVFNIMAFIGLSFYPTVPGKSGGWTLGFVAEKRRNYFQWPIWEMPLRPVEVSTLLHAAPEQMNPQRGVNQIWRSRRFSAEKSLYFAPAEMVS